MSKDVKVNSLSHPIKMITVHVHISIKVINTSSHLHSSMLYLHRLSDWWVLICTSEKNSSLQLSSSHSEKKLLLFSIFKFTCEFITFKFICEAFHIRNICFCTVVTCISKIVLIHSEFSIFIGTSRGIGIRIGIRTFLNTGICSVLILSYFFSTSRNIRYNTINAAICRLY